MSYEIVDGKPTEPSHLKDWFACVYRPQDSADWWLAGGLFVNQEEAEKNFRCYFSGGTAEVRVVRITLPVPALIQSPEPSPS